MRRVPLEFLVAVLLMGTFVGAYAVWTTLPRTESAPDFRLTTFDGHTFQLSDHRGHVVILDFFASWCASCELNAAALQEASQDWANDSYVILSIAVDPTDDPDRLRAYWNEQGVPWPLALDSDDVALKYGVVSLGRVLFVDADGDIAYDARDTLDADAARHAFARARDPDASAVPIPQMGLVTLATIAGVATFFSPCAVALLPAYAMASLPPATLAASPWTRFREQTRRGGAASLGLILVYLGVGGLVLVSAGVLRPYVPKLMAFVGLALVALGVLAFSNRTWWPMATPTSGQGPASEVGALPPSSMRRHFAYGMGYAGAASACTVPIMLQVAVAAIAAGPLLGGGVLVAYAASAALMMLLLTWAALLVPERVLRRMLRWAGLLPKITGVVFAAAGLYLLYYYWRAFA